MNRFQKWALATTAATFILIVVGGFVRASGSGLGCPEWPTCYGKPYPPLSVSDLEKRDIPEGVEVTAADVSRAWIEYINRLSGAVIGLLLLATTYYAVRDHRHTPRILYATLAALVTVLINGWLGGQVVESGLEPAKISAHLMLALVQVCLLIYATTSAFYPQGGLPSESLTRERRWLARASLVVLLMALVQVMFGADLRGQLGVIEDEQPNLERSQIIHEADWVDQFHRTFSWTILAGIFWLAWFTQTRMENDHAYLRNGALLAAALVIGQVLAGIGLAYAALPPPLQLAHVVIASLIIGVLTTLFLLATRLPMQSASSLSHASLNNQPSAIGD